MHAASVFGYIDIFGTQDLTSSILLMQGSAFERLGFCYAALNQCASFIDADIDVFGTDVLAEFLAADFDECCAACYAYVPVVTTDPKTSSKKCSVRTPPCTGSPLSVHGIRSALYLLMHGIPG